MLTLPISLIAVGFVWIAINSAVNTKKKSSSIKTKINYVKSCQAPVIRLEDGRMLSNISANS